MSHSWKVYAVQSDKNVFLKQLSQSGEKFFLGKTEKATLAQKIGRTLRSVHKICNDVQEGSSWVINAYCILLLWSLFASVGFYFHKGGLGKSGRQNRKALRVKNNKESLGE